ncbi:nucleotidyltransferase family protein [Lachnoclostridium phytofermentans]|uniref:Polymerase beta nucleotidyltransferase domain-containing protein n=1 Tax=Lachnoclostridium phytofermentans (strain ATCC 700394 / DSM 18823 / ISDg) TaxID=357809 RepID=A9KKW4_LACP7|nr:nucleotidyltransferase domain-containing protein [Lachnoclostridium phytofermentans]ABX42696.1 hypothetical protein Cphy_2335 [Lachnoclostridium phytofermentans ISDg]
MIEFEVNNRHFKLTPYPYHIEAFALFGSYINEEFDELSDIDMLIIIEDCSKQRVLSIKQSLAKALHVPKTWISIYTKRNFANLCANGDYWCWYLKLYAKICYSKTDFIRRAFNSLPPNINVLSHIYDNIETIEEEYQYFINHRASAEELMNLIAHFTRNACILLCYLHQVVDFKKYSPAKQCCSFPDITMPFTFEDYEKLYRLKRAFKHNYKNFRLRNEYHYVISWYEKYQELTHIVIAKAKELLRTNFVSPLISFLE